MEAEEKQCSTWSGWLFIAVMEILALMLAKGKLKPYKTATRLDHILDIYADDLTIYLEYNRKKDWKIRKMLKRSCKLCTNFRIGLASILTCEKHT